MPFLSHLPISSLIWKHSSHFFRGFFHSSLKPHFNPPIQGVSDIGRGIGGLCGLFRLWSIYFKEHILQQIDEPTLAQQAVEIPVFFQVEKELPYHLRYRFRRVALIGVDPLREQLMDIDVQNIFFHFKITVKGCSSNLSVAAQLADGNIIQRFIF